MVLWTVGVWLVSIPDLVKKVDLFLREEEGDRHSMYGRIAPSLSEREKTNGEGLAGNLVGRSEYWVFTS